MHLITDQQREYLATLPFKDRQKEILKEKYRNGEWYADDICKLHAGDIPRADIWCFGSPCQSFSMAGNREGLNGVSGLIGEIFRLLNETKEEDRPRYLISENVKGMLTSRKGFDFLRILMEMDRGGTMSNGSYSTLNGSFLRTESECSLLDILEDVVPQKYFLSKEQTERIVWK